MSIATYSAYLARLAGQWQRVLTGAVGVRTQASTTITSSSWSGTTPSTAVAPTNATAGAIGQLDSTSTQRVLRVIMGAAENIPFSFVLIDRLSHQGGLSGTVTSAQATNLPTAALTRYTSGVGVQAAIQVYTALGATPATFTTSYTNDAGTSGRTSEASALEAAVYGITSVPLQSGSGDKGVKAVASVTLSGSTGTAGNFGVLLYYPILVFQWDGSGRLSPNERAAIPNFVLPVVPNGACLEWLAMSGNRASPIFSGALALAED